VAGGGAVEPHWIGVLDCNLEDVWSSIGLIVDRARIEAYASKRTSLARRAEVTLHSCVEAGKEVELQSIAHFGGRGVGREDESVFADVNLDGFRDCAACCH